MTTIIKHTEILSVVKDIDIIAEMEKGFIEYSNGNVIVPPVGELLFDEPKGEAHIKYGYIKKDDSYCIKIASGFYDNPKLGIASCQGMMLLFNQKTGQPQAILLDNGLLTDLRTAAAGALTAKYFAPKNIQAIGIIGTGVQAKLQLQYLQKYISNKKVWLWGRTTDNALKFKSELAEFDINIAASPAELAARCNLIVTATSSESPLLFSDDINPGTHITAIGSDTPEKNELDNKLLCKADLLISDSIAQSKSRGEIYQAIKNHAISMDKVKELGSLIQSTFAQHLGSNNISIVDLTGVAVQDIVLAKAVYKRVINKRKQDDA